MNHKENKILKIIIKLRKFSKDREWDHYHSPKNLVMALSVEVSELVEIFQWKSQEESMKLTSKNKKQVIAEVGDIMLYLLLFCDKLGIDFLNAADTKLIINKRKYPISKSKGVFTKYSER